MQIHLDRSMSADASERGGLMEWAQFPIPAVATDPGYRGAPAEVQLAYFNTAMDLWMEACRSGRPSLPRKLVAQVEALLERDLAHEVGGRIEIGWVTFAWQEYLKRSKHGRAGAEARWAAKEQEKDARALLEQSSGNAPAMPGLSVCLSVPDSSSSSSPKRAHAKQTWLTPFADAWETRTDGFFEFGKAAKPLKKLVDLHGHDAVVEAFTAYLDATEPEHLSVARFAATYGGWSGTAPAAKRPTKKSSSTLGAEAAARRLGLNLKEVLS